jgi:hypothetical protein
VTVTSVFALQSSLDIIQSIEDDALLDARLLPQPSLQTHFRPRFYPLPTVIMANILFFIQVSCLDEGRLRRDDAPENVSALQRVGGLYLPLAEMYMLCTQTSTAENLS